MTKSLFIVQYYHLWTKDCLVVGLDFQQASISGTRIIKMHCYWCSRCDNAIFTDVINKCTTISQTSLWKLQYLVT